MTLLHHVSPVTASEPSGQENKKEEVVQGFDAHNGCDLKILALSSWSTTASAEWQMGKNLSGGSSARR